MGFLANLIPLHLASLPVTGNDALVAAAALICCSLVYYRRPSRKISHIPSLGRYGSSSILSYIDAIRYIVDPVTFMKEGRASLQGAQIAKIPFLLEWNVVVLSYELIEELCTAPVTVFSAAKATEVTIFSRYTFGKKVPDNLYHTGVVRNHLRRITPELFHDMFDEGMASFKDYFSIPDEGWHLVPLSDTFTKLIGRISNRIFVGVPTCRDEAFIKLGTEYAVDVITVAYVLSFFPAFLQPPVAVLLPTIDKGVKRALPFVAPLIRERREKREQLGHRYEPPEDFLTWLMEVAEGEETSEQALTARILLMNFASIHSTAITFTQALFDLALNPEYMTPLYEEVVKAVDEYGWSPEALQSMERLDSFVKESQRLRPINATVVNRYSVQDYTFGNGVRVPSGFLVCADVLGQQCDPRRYDNPDEFQPWRFFEQQQANPTNTPGEFLAKVSPDFAAFGYGKHACVGRWFAIVEIKMMLAHLILNYEVKSEVHGVRPKDWRFTSTILPNPNAKLWFRKRGKQ